MDTDRIDAPCICCPPTQGRPMGYPTFQTNCTRCGAKGIAFVGDKGAANNAPSPMTAAFAGLAGGKETIIDYRRTEYWSLGHCPLCKMPLAVVYQVEGEREAKTIIKAVYPHDKTTERYPRLAPPQLKDAIPEAARDFDDAGKLLHVVPRAGAVMARRSLELLLMKKGPTPKKKDGSEITKGVKLQQRVYAAVHDGDLPSYLGAALDSVRFWGNFGGHPSDQLDEDTGEIPDVTEQDLRDALDVLWEVIDHYVVKPGKMAKIAERAKATSPKTDYHEPKS